MYLPHPVRLSLCACFKGRWALYTFSDVSNIALLKDLTDLLPNYACWELEKHLHARLYIDILSVLALLNLLVLLILQMLTVLAGTAL